MCAKRGAKALDGTLTQTDNYSLFSKKFLRIVPFPGFSYMVDQIYINLEKIIHKKYVSLKK